RQGLLFRAQVCWIPRSPDGLSPAPPVVLTAIEGHGGFALARSIEWTRVGCQNRRKTGASEPLAQVELRGVEKVYAGGIPALRGIDLAVADGEFLAVVGPSGSGKSTLLRVVAGLEPLSAGGVWIGGEQVDGLPPHERGVA